MKNKIFLTILLATPLAVLLISTFLFNSGIGPTSTKNNGIFFDEHFDINNLNLFTQAGDLVFKDGKWIFGTYYSDELDLEKALYLMRQLNIALNRDIYKLKRVLFIQPTSKVEKVLSSYPRTEIVTDPEASFYKQLNNFGGENFFKDQKIFIIDPYGRAVMFFPASMDPRLILKDLKVLI